MPKGDKAKEAKAASAASKADAEAKAKAAAEDADWAEGSNSKAAAKKAAEAAAAAERARVKAAAEAQLRAETAEAEKQKLRGIEKVAARQAAKVLAASAEVDASAAPALVGRGIDAALAVLSIASAASPRAGGDGEDAGGGGGGVAGEQARVDRLLEAQAAGLKEDDKHPERRLKAAYARYRERELPLLKKEFPSLRMSQHVEVRAAPGPGPKLRARSAPLGGRPARHPPSLLSRRRAPAHPLPCRCLIARGKRARKTRCTRRKNWRKAPAAEAAAGGGERNRVY